MRCTSTTSHRMGNIDDTEWLIKGGIRDNYDTTTQLIGERVDLAKEARALNRTVRWTHHGVGGRGRPPPRHVDVIIEQLGIGQANPAPTPVYEQRERIMGWGREGAGRGIGIYSRATGDHADDGVAIDRTEDESLQPLTSVSMVAQMCAP